ncbi:Reverse transcriptase, RNA-dependent DNA polymerase [Penicillium italicum]|uniref:Reverse transcriptase, RNA-dependent DNA polymerase n=1 Tax=Penicillium italicum TaxID=40296 RepID=A0A0A2KJ67_PENIT|nr:Reverse transcriptase, RNA-dependent DNA polymerase [Penicillium italicum]
MTSDEKRATTLAAKTEATRVFKKLGLTQVPEDPCLFTADRIIVFFYVDDIIIVNHPTVRKEALKLREAIGHEWELRGLGEAQWFLGIRIIRDRKQGKLWLCQDSYLRSMGMKFGAIHRRRCDTPLPMEDLRPYDGKASPSEIHQYQQKIGAALHLDAIDRVISYLYQTRFFAIEYAADRGSEAVTSASDASFGDNADRKSSEGYLCTLFGGAVDWKAAKQRTVTTSTTEAELLALTEAGKTVQWWMRLFKEIGFDPEHPITIRCDNQQTVDLLRKEDPQLRTKLRHVDIHRHWLRQEVQEGRISVEWVPTAEMAADGLTKLLPRQKHQKFVEMLGLVDLRTHLSNHED